MEKENNTKEAKKQNYLPAIIIGAVALLAVAAYATGIFSFPTGQTTNENSEVVASVNSEEITREELDERAEMLGAAEEERNLVLNQMVNEALIRQEAKRRDVSVEPVDIEAAFANILSGLGSEEAFTQALQTEGITREDLRENIEDQILLENYIALITQEREIEVTEEEIEALYNEVAETQPEIAPLEEVRSQVEQQILEQKLQEVLSEIVEGLKAEAEIEILI